MLEARVKLFKSKLTIMNPLQSFQKSKALAARGLKPSTLSKGLVERISNYGMSRLMLVVVGLAVALKFKNIYEKNVLVAKEGVQLLRIFLVARRNVLGDDLLQTLLIKIKAFGPELYWQIDAINMPSETVVPVLWQYILTLALPH